MFNYLLYFFFLFVFDDVQHFKGSLDGRFGLVGIQTTGTQYLTIIVPGDHGLHQRIGSSAWGDGNSVVLQDGKRTVEILLIDIAQRLYEGIVLTVAGSRSLISLTVNLNLNICSRL